MPIFNNSRSNRLQWLQRSQLQFYDIGSILMPKIARSGDLGIWATRKYNLSVGIVEKLTSIRFESFGKVHERRKYCILLATPINTTHHVLPARAHNLAQYVGKGRQ